jgi:hypothetical protein
MTLVADIPAQGAPAYSIERQVRDQRIAVAEMWLCMLGGLREIGMRFAAFLEHQVAPSKAGPRRLMMAFRFIGDPCAAFSRVWRAVHLAAALALRIADEIAALRAGKPLGSAAPAAKTAREAKAIKDKIHEIGLEALAEDIETAERPEGLHGGLNDMLREERMDAAFYRLLKGPVKDVVAAICADLGLNPDWSQWTEDGFPPPPGGQKEDWVTYFIPEGEVESTPTQDRRAPRTPPPRRDAPCAWDKAWRPPWPPPERHHPDPAATRPPDRAVRPDDPGSRTRKASLLGTTIIAGAPGALERVIARQGYGSASMPSRWPSGSLSIKV